MFFIQLQPRFYEPDGVRGGACDDAGTGRCAEVHKGGFLAAIEFIGDDALAVAVCVEIYSAGGDDAAEVGPQAFEQRAPAFQFFDVAVAYGSVMALRLEGRWDVRENLEGLRKVAKCLAADALGVEVDACGDAAGFDLLLIEIALQTGFDDVERGSDEGGSHAAGPISTVSPYPL